MKFTHYKTRTDEILLEEKMVKVTRASYKEIVERYQNAPLADFYTTQIKEVYRQFEKALG